MPIRGGRPPPHVEDKYAYKVFDSGEFFQYDATGMCAFHKSINGKYTSAASLNLKRPDVIISCEVW